jgi:hypothetical protein
LKEIFLLVGKVHGHFSPSSPASLLDVSAGYCQKALIGESGMIRAQMGKHNRSVMVAVYGTPCATRPRKG